MLLRWMMVNYMLGGREGARRFVQALGWIVVIVVGFVALLVVRW